MSCISSSNQMSCNCRTIKLQKSSTNIRKIFRTSRESVRKHPETSRTPPNMSETPPNTSRTPREYPKMLRKSSENIKTTPGKQTDWGQMLTLRKICFQKIELPGPRNSRSPRKFIACDYFFKSFGRFYFYFLKVDFFFWPKMST